MAPPRPGFDQALEAVVALFSLAVGAQETAVREGMPGRVRKIPPGHRLHRRAGVAEGVEAKAEPIIAEELRRLGWSQTELATWRKRDPGKLAIGARLRRETTLSVEAIAGSVHLGTSKSASAQLHKWMRLAGPGHSAQTKLGI